MCNLTKYGRTPKAAYSGDELRSSDDKNVEQLRSILMLRWHEIYYSAMNIYSMCFISNRINLAAFLAGPRHWRTLPEDASAWKASDDLQKSLLITQVF